MDEGSWILSRASQAEGLQCRVWSVGCRVWGVGCRVQGVKCGHTTAEGSLLWELKLLEVL